MEDLRLVLIDVDGCLKPPAPLSIDLDVLQVLRLYNRTRARSNRNAMISLVSGRSQSDIQLLLGLIECPVSGICENGAGLVLGRDETVLIDPLVTNEVLTSLSDLREHLYETLVKTGLGHLKSDRSWSITVCPSRPEDLPSIEILCGEIILARGYPLRCFVSSRCVDILPEGVNKSTGASRLTTALGIPLSVVGAIGDSAGDIPLLTQVGFSACPNNADGSVKRVVDFVAQSDFSRGVLEILSRWLGESGIGVSA